jgi:hypothetical protein
MTAIGKRAYCCRLHIDAHSRGKKSFSCEYEIQFSESVPEWDFVQSAQRKILKIFKRKEK